MRGSKKTGREDVDPEAEATTSYGPKEGEKRAKR